jgi:hypothetical protein
MTAVEDYNAAVDDTIEKVITLLLAEETISDIVDERLLPEDGNLIPGKSYPYGEVISVRADKGKYESGAFKDLEIELLIQWYINDMGPVAKNTVKTLANTSMAIIEKNFNVGPWRDIDWKGTRYNGIIEDEGRPVERFSQVNYGFFVQVRRND